MAKYQDAQGNIIEVDEDGTRRTYAAPYTPPTGPIEAGLVAAGDTFTRTADFLAGPLWDRPEDEAQMMRNLQQRHPVATTIGGALPEVLVPGGAMKGAAGWLGNRAIDAAISVATGPEDMGLMERAAWGAGGGAAGDMATRIFSNAGKFLKGLADPPAPVSRTHAKMARQFLDAGGELTPGQATGQRGLKNLESGLETGFFTGSMTDDLIERNSQKFSKAVGKAAGLPDDYIDDMVRFDIDALTTAKDLSSAQFKDIASQIGRVDVDEELAGTLHKIIKKDARELLKRQGIEIPGEGGFSLTGEQAMVLRSGLRGIRDKAANAGNVPRMDLYGEYLDELDEAIEASAPEGLKDAYSAVRDQYRVLKKLEKAHMSPEGGVTPGSVWKQFIKDDSPLVEELRPFAQSYASNPLKIPFNVSSSGRAMNQGLIPMAGNLLQAPLAKGYFEQGAGGTIPRVYPSLVDMMNSSTNRGLLQLGAGTGRGFATQRNQ